jgi:hypothetical protein
LSFGGFALGERLWYNGRKATIGEEILSPLLQALLVTCAKLLPATQWQRNFEGPPSRRKAAPGFFQPVRTLWYHSHNKVVSFEEFLAGRSPLRRGPHRNLKGSEKYNPQSGLLSTG